MSAKPATSNSTSVILAFVFGVAFISFILAIALFVPKPTAFQYTVFRIILSVAAAGVAAVIPGIFKIKIAKWLSASGALAIFAAVYFYAPANLVPLPDIEKIEKGINGVRTDTTALNGKTDEILAKQDKILAALREYPATLSQVSQAGAKEDETAPIARAYAVLDAKFQLPSGTLAKDLPKFAAQLLQRRDTSVIDRASALFAVKQFAAAEAAALEAKDKALAAAGQPVKDAIAAFELAGNAAFAQTRYTRALDHYRAAAALTDEMRDSGEWARMRNNIAHVFSDEGNYSQATEVLRPVVETLQRVLGPEHPYTLGSRNNLGAALNSQGKNAEAEMELRAALSILERVLGPKDPATLKSRNNLASALRSQGKLVEAEAENRAVLAIRQRVLGREHFDTLSTHNNLALVLASQRKLPEAVAELRTVQRVQERVLGPEHGHTLGTRNNVATLLYNQGKYAEAEAEHRAVLAIRKRILGPEHLETLASHRSLSIALLAQGKHAEAEAALRDVLRIEEHILGPEHPDTLKSLHNLASQLYAQRKFAEAETENRAALRMMDRVLGAQNANAILACYNLAMCLQAQGKIPEALSFARRALEGRRKALGDSHPDTKDAQKLFNSLEQSQKTK